MCDSSLVIINTCSSEAEAERIARALVEEQLAACVQILPGMRSIYRWQGAVETAQEHLLLIKSSPALYKAVEAKIVEMHSYDVPEVLAIPVTQASEKYLAWLGGQLRG